MKIKVRKLVVINNDNNNENKIKKYDLNLNSSVHHMKQLCKQLKCD